MFVSGKYDDCRAAVLRWSLCAVFALPPYQAVRADEPVLEEIYVTARKREESLQQTPVSVTAFGTDDLQALTVSDISTLGNFTPNLNLAFSQGNSGGSSLGASIRGVGQFDFLITTDPGVGVYLDGVYLGRTSGSVLDLLNVERIEVLRGPQGTVFGKNTIGGAINVVTKRPGEDFEGTAKLVLGEDARVDTQLSVGGALADGVAAQFSLASNNRDGYVERLLDGGELGDIDQLVSRAALSWAPTDTFSATFIADATRQRQSSMPSLLAEINPAGSVIGLYNGLNVGGVALTPADAAAARADYSRTRQTGPSRDDLDIIGVNTTLEWQLADMTLRSITAYRDMQADFSRDGDSTPLQYVETANRVEQDQVSQELQLLGTARDQRLNWMLGFYYYKEDASDFNRPRLGSGLFAALEALPGQVNGDACAAPFVAPGCTGNPINVALDLDLNILTEQEVTSNALFGNLSYLFADAWTLNIGLRYTDEEKNFAIQSFREGSGAVIFPPGTTAAEDWQEFSYRAGLDYQLNDDTLFYASASRGFRSGGFNARPTTEGALQTYEPEFLRSLEVGVKADLLGRRLRLNAALFVNDYKDIQLLSRSLDPATGTFISLLQNAARASINGMEVELTALLSDRLTLQFGLGYLDAEYDDIGNAVGITTDSELFQTPDYNANLALTYDYPLGNGASWSNRLDYGYTDAFFLEAINTRSLEESGYGVANLRSAYRSADGRYEIAAFVSNVGDEAYFVSGGSALDSLGTAEVTPARGREWGVAVVYSF